MPDFSYRCENFSFFHILSSVSKVAIKVVCLRREHRARLLKRTNAKDDQAAADDNDDDADADDDDDDVKPKTTTTSPTTTTQMPYQHLQQ